MKNSPLLLSGKNLTVEAVIQFCKNPRAQISIDPKCEKTIRQARKFLDAHAKTQVIYGVNTGFGPMANRILTSAQLDDLQRNLILSHACGMGEGVNPQFVLAAMVMRLNSLLKGYSGVTWELITFYARLINLRIIPWVPEHGAVGTSGDLIQLSHIALAFLGEGKVWHNGEYKTAKEVFKKLNILPHTLQAKEGLALINGTSFMTGIAAHIVSQAEKALALAIRTGAWSLETVEAYDDSLDKLLATARPHPGQAAVCKAMRNILATSRRLKDRATSLKGMRLHDHVQALDHAIQEVYSLRCTSQILGPIQETLASAKRIVETEMNSATDNPLLDLKNKSFVHGGNFHGDYISAAIDSLKAAIVKLTMLSERRINFFLNPNIQKDLPPFLNLHTPGLTLSLQGLQFVATSTTALSQSLAYPHHLHSISTNGDNQDVVSMGTDGALLAYKVLTNAFVVLSIEAVCLAQATDILSISPKLSKATKTLFKTIRAHVPPVMNDRPLSEEMNRLAEILKLS